MARSVTSEHIDEAVEQRRQVHIKGLTTFPGLSASEWDQSFERAR